MSMVNSQIHNYDSEEKAARELQSFYRENAISLGQEKKFNIQGIINGCSVKIISDLSIFHSQKTGLEFSVNPGDKLSMDILKRLGTLVHTDKTPVAKINVYLLLFGNCYTNVSESFTPKNSPYSDMFRVSAFEDQNLFIKPVINNTLNQNIPKLSSQTIRELKNEIRENAYVIKEPDISLKAENCKFMDDVNVKGNIAFDGTEVKGITQSFNGCIKAKNSTLEEVDVREKDLSLIDTYALWAKAGGNLEWINQIKFDGKEVNFVKCGGTLEIEGIHVKNVTGDDQRIKATNCMIGDIVSKCGDGIEANNCILSNVKSEGKIKLTNGTHASKVTIKVPQVPVCRIILDNSSIDEVIFEDDPISKSVAKLKGHYVSALPPTFNYPNQILKGSFSGNASGRIEGEPYQFTQNTYEKGIKVEIVGEGKIGKISYKNCEAQMVDISKTIKIEQ